MADGYVSVKAIESNPMTRSVVSGGSTSFTFTLSWNYTGGITGYLEWGPFTIRVSSGGGAAPQSKTTNVIQHEGLSEAEVNANIQAELNGITMSSFNEVFGDCAV